MVSTKRRIHDSYGSVLVELIEGEGKSATEMLSGRLSCSPAN
jgi:hypothetical protein